MSYIDSVDGDRIDMIGRRDINDIPSEYPGTENVSQNGLSFNNFSHAQGKWPFSGIRFKMAILPVSRGESRISPGVDNRGSLRIFSLLFLPELPSPQGLIWKRC